MTNPYRQYATTKTALGKLPMLLAAASVVAVSLTAPSYADDHDRNPQNRDRMSRGDNEHRDQRGHRDRRHYRPDYRAPYSYAQPVYVPPPVYYEPQRSPGISLFFPLDLR